MSSALFTYGPPSQDQEQQYLGSVWFIVKASDIFYLEQWCLYEGAVFKCCDN